MTLLKHRLGSQTPVIPEWQGVLLIFLLTAGWCFLWFYPWQTELGNFPWLRLGIALGTFLVPGICLYGFLSNGSSGWLNFPTFGFAISHLLWGLLGILGRLFHLSFEFLRNGVMIFSLILLISYVVPRLKTLKFPKMDLSVIRNLADYWPLILTIILTVLMVIQRVISDDDLTYIAYITNWQKSTSLNFNDVIFGVEKPTSTRFWIASVPFAQAFLADISRLAGIYVVGGFYEPFLVVLSIAGAYELARSFGLSNSVSMLGVGAQVIFLSLLSDYLHPGAPFFRQLSVDKATAAFILVPVFIQSALGFLSEATYKNAILLLLTGLSLMTTHPVMLVFAMMVAGLTALFGMTRSNLHEIIVLFVLFVGILAPPSVIRFVKTEAQGVVPYATEDVLNAGGIENLIRVWGDTIFYGFNPSILAMTFPIPSNNSVVRIILQSGWIIFPLLAALCAFKYARQDPLARYVLASFLLVAIAGIPFTGWMLGYFVSAFMLERSTWLYPYGLGAIFLGVAIGRSSYFWNQFSTRGATVRQKNKIDLSKLSLSVAHVFSIALIWLIMRGQNLPNIERLEKNSQRYQELVLVGRFLDEHIPDQAFVIGTDELNDLLPAISDKAKVISYRPTDPPHSYFFTPEERRQRFLDRQAIFSPNVSVNERLSLIEKYNIRFIWLKTGEYYMVKLLVSTRPSHYKVNQVGRYYLIEAR